MEAAGEGGFIPEPEDEKFPDFKNPSNLQALPRTSTALSRLETMQEMQQINDRLAKDGSQIKMATLQRAMLVPDDIEVDYTKLDDIKRDAKGQPDGDPEYTAHYPDPGVLLMENPFPKVKKGKKKKKKK